MSACDGPFLVRVLAPAEPTAIRTQTPAEPALIRQVVPGPMGAAGRDGADGSALTLTAGRDLSGHRIVRALPDGTVVYASALSPGEAASALGLTLAAAEAGKPVEVATVGSVLELSWSWAPGLPVWLGRDGALAQTPDPLGDFRSIGVAITANRLALALGAPLIRI